MVSGVGIQSNYHNVGPFIRKMIPSSQQPKSDRQEVLNEYAQGLADASPGRITFAIGDGWLKG